MKIAGLQLAKGSVQNEEAIGQMRTEFFSLLPHMTDLAMRIKGSKQSGVNFLANKMAVDGASPINPGESVFGAAIRVGHGQESGKIMLLRVAIVVAVTGDLEFPPEGSVLDDEERVAARDGEELRSDAKLVEGDLGRHGVAATGDVALPELGRVGDDFDEGFAARGGDEGGGGAEGAFGGDEFGLEEGGEGAREVDGGVGVDVDVEEVGGDVAEEGVPERGEVKIGVGEEEEGDFEGGVEEFGGVVGVGVGIGVSDCTFVGGGNGDAVGSRWEDSWCQEEQDWEGEEEREG
ncbi:hypothetical protein CR513_38108, partial [Mucuna pruriens]